MKLVAPGIAHGPRTVDIWQLKRIFATDKMRDRGGLLAEVILAERDQMAATDFLAKVETWLTLVAKEDSAGLG